MKLSDLDPVAVARAVCDALVARRAREDFKLAPALSPPGPDAVDALAESKLEWGALLADHETRALVGRALARGWQAATELDPDALARGSDLGLTVQALVTYAQRGRAWDWQGASEARDALQTLAEVLGEAGLPGAGAADPDALALVLRAAWARVQIARGEPVPQRWLCALGGVTDGRVRQLVAAKTLRRVGRVKRGGANPGAGGHVTAASASAWLGAQRVEGYCEATGVPVFYGAAPSGAAE